MKPRCIHLLLGAIEQASGIRALSHFGDFDGALSIFHESDDGGALSPPLAAAAACAFARMGQDDACRSLVNRVKSQVRIDSPNMLLQFSYIYENSLSSIL